MARQKQPIKTGMRNIPFIPDQGEFDWVANYIDSKKDELYSVVFAYQMIDGYLRMLVMNRSNKKEADMRGVEKLIKKFKELYPEYKKLSSNLFSWKEKRDTINHSLLFDERIYGPKQLDKFINEISKSGFSLFSELQKILNQVIASRKPK